MLQPRFLIPAAALTALAGLAMLWAGAVRRPEGNWVYSEKPGAAGGTDYYARVTSSNRIRQRPPYQAATFMDMTISSGANRPDLTLEVSSGRLMCPSYAGCTASVRFDDGPEQAVAFEGFLDNRTNTMFLRDARPFIAELRRARRVTIAKTMLGAGTARFRFDVAGLRWAH